MFRSALTLTAAAALMLSVSVRYHQFEAQEAPIQEHSQSYDESNIQSSGQESADDQNAALPKTVGIGVSAVQRIRRMEGKGTLQLQRRGASIGPGRFG